MIDDDDAAFERTDAHLDLLREQVRYAENKAGVAGWVAVGQLLLDDLYNSDFAAFQRRNGHKKSSLRRFAQLTRKSRTLLANKIRVYEMYHRLVGPWRDQVKPSVLVEILAAPPEHQNALVERAALEEWGIIQTRRVINPSWKPSRTPRRTTPQRWVNEGERALAEAAKAHRTPREAAAMAKHARDAIAVLQRVIDVCENGPPAAAPTQASTKKVPPN